MATNSFFYGDTPSPEANTVDQLIDALNQKVQSVDADKVAAEEAASQAAASATGAAGASAAAVAAASQAIEAEASATNSASSATISANAASNSAAAAAASAVAADSSASAASSSAASALSSKNSVDATYDLFDDRYLGAKASDPTVDNDGNALIDGAMYFDTVNNVTKIYDLGTTSWKRTTPTTTDQANIDSVTANATNINTVAGSISNVNTVSGSIANVNSVAGNATNINTVAADIASVVTNATNIVAIQNASANANTAAAQATIATNQANTATAQAVISTNNATLASGYATQASNSASAASNSATSASNSASSASTSATNAANSAANAAAAIGAPAWVSGTTYAIGALVYSTVDRRTYRRLTAGAGTTDPSADATNWVALSVVVESSDVGTAPNQIPLNQYLGSMAYQNSENVVVQNITVTGTLTANNALVGSFSWNTATSSPASATGGQNIVLGVHDKMRRCVVLDSGVVNYYLDPFDSTKKADGTAAVLTGADGQVMVEIPKFYTRRTVSGTIITWEISAFPQAGFTVHPAFIKDGVEVNYRYYGAYDACVYDVGGATYLSGLNYDNNSGANGVQVDVTATTGDKLASVSGIYPMVGLTRAEFRTLAANRGTFWRQLDFTLWSAVQMLYLIEYQSFYSQAILGAGNTNGSYLASSGVQADSPHTIAGASNWLGNGSTNTTSGAGVSAKPGTSYMVYRGIENLYGNCWNWADGINVNVGTNGYVYVTNNRADFADDTSTNMTLIATNASTAADYASALSAIDNYFIASSVSGGSSSTYLTDYWYGSTSSNRVVFVGGSAYYAALAGAFHVLANSASSVRDRGIGGRLAG